MWSPPGAVDLFAGHDITCSPAREATVRMFGLTVQGTLPMAPSRPKSARPPEVQITAGPVADGGVLIWDAASTASASCWRQNDAVILAWPGLRAAITAETIVVDAPDPSTAYALYFQPIWATLLALRGTEVFHGSAVARNDGAFAVLGVSGAGKSTAALSLVRRGWEFVTDDLLAFDQRGGLLAGPPFLRLDPRSLPPSGVSALDGGGKVRWRAPSSIDAESPRTVLVLDDRFPRLARVRGARAVDAILRHVYLPPIVQTDQASRRLDRALALVERASIFGAPPRSLTAAELERLASEG